MIPSGLNRRTYRLRSLIDRHQIGRYIIVGFISVVLHLVLLLLLVEMWNLSPPIASSLAFASVAIFAFFFHHHWVYATSESRRQTFPRFVTVATVAFLVNGATMLFGDSYGTDHYLLSQFIAFVLIPLSNYIIHSLWTFAEHR